MESHKMYNARITACEMLRDRGYIIDEDNIYISSAEYNMKRMNDDLNIYTHHKDDPNNKMYLKFITHRKRINDSDLKKETQLISIDTNHGSEYMGIPNIIFIVQEKSSSNVAVNIGIDKFENVEVFVINKLQINPTKHDLVPKHELVPKNKEDEVLTLFNCTKKDLPKILSSVDPIAKYYGMKPGNICKITRKSEQTGAQIFYRHVK